MAYSYKIKGTVERPTHLFRYPPNFGTPEFLGVDGDWHPDADLLAYALHDPLGADDVSRADARRVASIMRMPTAVPAH